MEIHELGTDEEEVSMLDEVSMYQLRGWPSTPTLSACDPCFDMGKKEVRILGRQSSVDDAGVPPNFGGLLKFVRALMGLQLLDRIG